jgi:general secretion pathway protein K
MRSARRRPTLASRTRERGAALLAAMLTVTLVATVAAGALWQQWRSVEVETAERGRMQAGWILNGALDWARLILREDGRTGGVDSLSEPWAVALKEVRLSTFLASQQGVTDADTADLPNAFLAGRITDLQSRLNLANLRASPEMHEATLRSLRALLQTLGQPPSMADRIGAALQAPATGNGASAAAAGAPADDMLPLQALDQLAWIGVPAGLLETLEQHLTVLPVATPININTADVTVLQASIPGIDLAGARRLVELREQAAFRSLADARERLAMAQVQLEETRHAVATRFFEVQGSLRLGSVVVHERSVLQRDGLEVRVLSRERGARRSTVAPARG